MKFDKFGKLGQLKMPDLKNSVGKLKERWKSQPGKTKELVAAIGGGILCTAVLMAVVVGNSTGKYKVLFPGMSDTESVEVYAALQDMGVDSRIDSGGQVLVPTDQWEQLVFELNGQGYPQTAPSYDTFTSLSGFTSTEFEKKAGLIFQAQDRMQETLVRQEGIKAATVTFSVPESSSYIWDESNQQKSTGNVTVQMKPGYELTPERVSAIKHLASTSIPKLDPEDVVVIDAATGVEMPGVDDAGSEGYPEKTIIFQGNDYSLEFKASDLERVIPQREIYDFRMSFTSPDEDIIYDHIWDYSRNDDIDNRIVMLYFEQHTSLPGPATLHVSLGSRYDNDTLYWHYYNQERDRIDYYGSLQSNSKGNIAVRIDHFSTYLISPKHRIAGSADKEGVIDELGQTTNGGDSLDQSGSKPFPNTGAGEGA